ncbi:MAG TPA: ATP-binding protein, partial [Hyphomonas sp.]|nr:ATP-binding protein [Hyphomonas sp.]
MMDSNFIGGADAEGTGTPNVAQNLLLKIANRHGLIAGATGTGKTVTLQNLAQGFSDAGVPVFCAD